MYASTSSERTPLVQPAYVYESSLTRNYRRRLRHIQCAICATILAVLGIALLVTVSYNLDQYNQEVNNSTEPSPGGGNLTALPPDVAPLLQLTWPLSDQPPADWIVTNLPTTKAISAAVANGNMALAAKKESEVARSSLPPGTPAAKAQRAAATSAAVAPMADAAYAAEHATRALVNGTDASQRLGGVGLGPPTGNSWLLPEYCQPPIPCPVAKYRTINGTCNNVKHSRRWGVANTPFRRALPPDYADGISKPRNGTSGELPSARDVSVTVHRPSYAHDSSFTVMLAVWGQFLDHDVTATALSKGANSSSLSCCDPTQKPHPECFPVRLDKEDPFYEDYNLTCMEFVRSAPAPTCHFGPREQLNQATAFIDGSTIYGPSEVKVDRLRSYSGGTLRMLRVGGVELLPQSTDPDDSCNTAEMNAIGRYCFESGDDRANENLHLTTMHLLWARQHNRLASALQEMNPKWNDETVFQESRKIVGAQMQHITYTEFLPAILGSDVMWALNLTGESRGYTQLYDETIDPSIANHFAASAFRFAHTLLPGLIHNVKVQSTSDEYIHLHDMLFNPYMLYMAEGPRRAVQSALVTPVHSVDPHVTTELSNHLFEKPISANTSQFQSAHGPCGLDLVSLNIQRGRDHGLPGYPAWRERCGFPRPKTFDDLQDIFDEQSLQRIKIIYKEVDDIDLYTGALAEQPRGRLLASTLTCLLADQFVRLKRGDRFWYENPPPHGFTLDQLTEIRKTTLAGIICANENLLDQVQPRVMETVSATNPLMDCQELPQPDLQPWRQDA